VLTAAFAAWVGCADLLVTEAAFCDSCASLSAGLQTQFRLTSGVLPAQFCRFIPCRSSVRTIERTNEEQDSSREDSPRLTIAVRPNSQSFTTVIPFLQIITPDHLIELPGTPPPAARS
jgi:hypothetical protein